MSNDDQIHVDGAPSEWLRPASGWLMLAVGLAVGVAASVLFMNTGTPTSPTVGPAASSFTSVEVTPRALSVDVSLGADHLWPETPTELSPVELAELFASEALGWESAQGTEFPDSVPSGPAWVRVRQSGVEELVDVLTVLSPDGGRVIVEVGPPWFRGAEFSPSDSGGTTVSLLRIRGGVGGEVTLRLAHGRHVVAFPTEAGGSVSEHVIVSDARPESVTSVLIRYINADGTVIAANGTSTLSLSSNSVLRTELEDQVAEAEAELAAAQEREFELGLLFDPASFAPVVDCDASAGIFFDRGGHAEGSYFVGPVGFYELIETVSTGDSSYQVSAVVEGGDSVTLVVPESERGSYSLNWNPALRPVDGQPVVSGEPAVTLRACSSATMFVGGFATARSEFCAPLDIYLEGNTEPSRIVLPFGGVDCPDQGEALARAQLGPLPDVTGMTLRNARFALRLVGVVPEVHEGEPFAPDSVVWAQEPNDGGTYRWLTVVGLRACRRGDDVATTYQERLDGTGITVSNAWMAPSDDSDPDSLWFVSARVSGGVNDGQIATWGIPGFGYGIGPDPVNTPKWSIPANAASAGFEFGDRGLQPESFGADNWFDLDGAVASQRCVEASTG